MNRLFDNLPFIGKKVSGKIVLSFLMLVLAIILLIIFDSLPRFFCVIAMTFSFIGDIILNNKKDHNMQTKSDFIFGGIAFIMAHIFYFFTYYRKIQINNYYLINFGAFIVIFITACISFVFIIKMISSKKINKLLIFGIFYVWITSINYIAIFSYAYSSFSLKSFVVVGGFSFLISDLIIASEKFFKVKSEFLREAVWWFYPIGQIILIIMV